MNYLRKTYVLLAFLSMSFLAFCYCTPAGFGGGDDSKFKDIIKNVRRTLSYFHYGQPKIDDHFSEDVYKRYMEMLDGAKNYYKPSDIAYFDQYKDDLDEMYEDEDLTFYHQTIDTLYNRMLELETLTQTMLKVPFDFTKEETISFDYENLSYPKTEMEWKSNWRKRLKYNVLQEIMIMQDMAKDTATTKDNKALDEDELTPEKVRNMSFEDLEIYARKEVKENMDDFFRRFKKRDKNDWLTVYINSFTEEYDPHTTYFSPKQNEDFVVNMSGQLEGIGATLADEKGYPTIKSLIIGGPAWKQGDLEVEDKITKVAQGDEQAVKVVGMLLEDAIRLIRGKKGTKVVLTVQKRDGSFKEIPIVRDVVEIEETFVRSAIITDENNEKYGIIYLPSFYLKYDEDGHDASDDILHEIEALKQENVKGIVFDVRNNGGGDLKETVEIAGHFIEKGPVVQVLSSDGEKRILKDKDKSIAWDGPLVVMVNEFSASASEILAAALQDYKRAVIVGSPKTYGKGTVQTVRPLSMFMQSKDDYGALKFTIQKFYRINGGSTQRKGVSSDVVMPDRYTYIDISEASQPTALKWDQIASLDYDVWQNAVPYSEIEKKSKERTSSSAQLKLLDENAHWVKDLSDDKLISLNYENFKAKSEYRDEMNKKFEALSNYKNGLKTSSPAYEIPLMENDTVLRERRKKWHENLTKDYYLQESVNILRDLN